jgi:hypothetical protein
VTTDSPDILTCLADVARRWLDPDYPARQAAVEETLAAENHFTEAATAFAINQQMSLLTKEALGAWQQDLLPTAAQTTPGERERVAVLNPGNIPFVELQDLVAVLISGRAYAGTVSSRSPALLPAFVSDLLACDDALPLELTDWQRALSGAERVIAAGTDQTMGIVRQATREAGLPISHCWLRGHRYAAAVLGGSESSDDLVDLAEDVLLHEGQGCRNVALVFAPSSMDIDPVLDAFAHFRGMFAAHERTSGSLKMQQAMLKAVGAPHAWADGHAFLISRGTPEVRGACHLRWVPYHERSEVEEWIRSHQTELQGVFSGVRLQVAPDIVHPLGTAQRPTLDWCPDGRSHADFFSASP